MGSGPHGGERAGEGAVRGHVLSVRVIIWDKIFFFLVFSIKGEKGEEEREGEGERVRESERKRERKRERERESE